MSSEPFKRLLVLGSTSLYRRELLQRLRLPFEVVSPQVDETPLDGEAPQALAETKKLIAALGPLSPDGYAEAGALAFARCASGPEAREGIAAFKEKRPPAWAS